MVHIRALDLNLIAIAAALYRTRNVSRAAAELGVSQSAVSHALARLRTHFGDPLFVRGSRGVVSTDFAEGVREEILELERRSKALFARREAFDPARASGRVTIAGTDYLEAVAMPLLLPELVREAPGVQISLRSTSGDLPRRELQEGLIDLAIAGFYSRVPEGFYQTRLFSDSFAVAGRRDHPDLKSPPTEERYLSLTHALVTLQGDLRDDVGSGKGAKRKVRRIVYGSFSFTGMAWALERTDLVLTAPSLLLRRYAERFRLRVQPCPIDLGRIDVRMVWHARTHRDPLCAWVREQIRHVGSRLATHSGSFSRAS